MSQPASGSSHGFARPEVEDFLFAESALLDEWRLDEWLALFTDDATYSVPPTDAPGSDPADTLFLISDDKARLCSRVEQLEGKTTWSESPRSRTRRMISNVRILEVEGDRSVVTANFVVYRMKNDRTSTYVGHLRYVLIRAAGSFRIQDRRAVLDLESLRDVGKVSFIL